MPGTILLKFKKILDQIINAFGIILFCGIFFVVLLQISLRWIFRSPLSWGDELPRYLYIWVCFLGWVYATRNGSHIIVSALVNAMPILLKKIIFVFNSILLIVFSIAMIIFGLNMMVKSINSPTVTLFFSFAYIYAAVPVSSILIIIYSIINIIQMLSLKNQKEIKIGEGAIQ